MSLKLFAVATFRMIIHWTCVSIGYGIDSAMTFAALPPASGIRRKCIVVWSVSIVLLIGSSPICPYCAARVALLVRAVWTIVSPIA